MSTQCTPEQLEFHALGRRQVVGRFDGGRITSDGGGLLLRETDLRIGLLGRLSHCFTDYRNEESLEHSVRALVSQRVYALALGYEDLNDHDALRADSTLALWQSAGVPEYVDELLEDLRVSLWCRQVLVVFLLGTSGDGCERKAQESSE